MAEMVMRDIVRREGKENEYIIASSATSTEEIGNPVYPPARRELLAHGIDPSGKVAVQLSPRDADKYDMFIGMDSANMRNIRRILGAGAEGKLYKMMSFVGSDDDVARHWYMGGFDKTYMDVSRACLALLELNGGDKM
jgi:protein-tyrosine-phosphatase